ncbi:MAG: hypothetical protein ACOCVV_01865 [Marinobacter sp.]
MFSKQEAEGLARKAIAALIGAMLAFALLSTLLIAGLVLLLWAATAGLTPVVGQAGALAIAGATCFLLLGLFFWRLIRARATSGEGEGEPGLTLRERLEQTIRENPLEAALGAFALGIFGQADARFRAMVLQSGIAFMRQVSAESAESPGDADSPPEDDGKPLGGEP